MAPSWRPPKRLDESDPELTTRGSYDGCIVGALSTSESKAGPRADGFENFSVEFTHQVADGMRQCDHQGDADNRSRSQREQAAKPEVLLGCVVVADCRSAGHFAFRTGWAEVAEAHRPWSRATAGVDAVKVEVQVGPARMAAVADVSDHVAGADGASGS